MSITEDRKKVVDFTNKYYNTPAKFIGAKGAGLTDTVEGLAGKVVGVQRGTIHQDFMEQKFPGVELKLYGTQDEVYLDLEAGRIDAAMADSVAMAEGFLNTDAGSGFDFFGKDYSDPQIHGEGAGIAVRQEDDDLREKLNAAIKLIRENGTYDKIAKKYFNFNVYGS
jgi:arginine/ornithine transport system substrate-binding protein